ncbi:MAG: response regulator, partial [Proteobacteria bacterium]
LWYLNGDPERIRQILVNLIGNAVKFTDHGQVRLTVQALGTSRDKRRLKFSVMDTGAGFSEEERLNLFQKYFQTKSGMKYGGTGLGLSICHQLVELMGGEIDVKSEPGMGSTFWFTLELPEAKAIDIPEQHDQHFAPLFRGKVLLVEDQLVNQRVATLYAQKLGLDVELAVNGAIAVSMVQKTKYDLIFMDCQMPVMTGYEATRKIRALETSRTPIIALTAEGTSGERSSCIEAGMDDFLTKPLEVERLTETLKRWLPAVVPVINPSSLEKLRAYVVNNKSLAQALIEDFFATAPGLVDQITTALAQKNLSDARSAAHALKSTAATLGAHELSKTAGLIEASTSVDAALNEIENLTTHLEQSIDHLQQYITRNAA